MTEKEKILENCVVKMALENFYYNSNTSWASLEIISNLDSAFEYFTKMLEDIVSTARYYPTICLEDLLKHTKKVKKKNDSIDFFLFMDLLRKNSGRENIIRLLLQLTQPITEEEFLSNSDSLLPYLKLIKKYNNAELEDNSSVTLVKELSDSHETAYEIVKKSKRCINKSSILCELTDDEILENVYNFSWSTLLRIKKVRKFLTSKPKTLSKFKIALDADIINNLITFITNNGNKLLDEDDRKFFIETIKGYGFSEFYKSLISGRLNCYYCCHAPAFKLFIDNGLDINTEIEGEKEETDSDRIRILIRLLLNNDFVRSGISLNYTYLVNTITTPELKELEKKYILKEE